MCATTASPGYTKRAAAHHNYPMEAQASSTMLGETGKRVAASVSDHWKPPPPSPSRVKVYDEDKLAMLLGDAPPPTHQSVTLGRTRSIHAAMRAQQRSEKRRQAREAEEQRVRRYERHRDEANKRQAEAERAVREQLIESAARRERKFNELRSDIVEGHKLADEIQQHLSLQEMNARTKLKRQFDEWNDGVYGAIQDQINDRLGGATFLLSNCTNEYRGAGPCCKCDVGLAHAARTGNARWAAFADDDVFFDASSLRASLEPLDETKAFAVVPSGARNRAGKG